MKIKKWIKPYFKYPDGKKKKIAGHYKLVSNQHTKKRGKK